MKGKVVAWLVVAGAILSSMLCIGRIMTLLSSFSL